MLTNLTKRSLIRACLANNVKAVTSQNSLFQVKSPKVDQDVEFHIKNETIHLNQFVNGIKTSLYQQISINFATQKDGKTLLLQTEQGQNTWKLGQVLLLGGGFKFLGLLAGFPSYAAIVGTLGVAGVGGLLSYSNYLRRTSSQITNIYLTADNRLLIQYLKADSMFTQSQRQLTVDKKSLNFASFENCWINWIRKNSNTQWLRIDNQLFWFNSENSRTNNHIYKGLF